MFQIHMYSNPQNTEKSLLNHKHCSREGRHGRNKGEELSLYICVCVYIYKYEGDPKNWNYLTEDRYLVVLASPPK